MDPPGYRYDPRLSPLNSWWSLGEAKGSLWFTLNRWEFEVGGVAYTVGYTHVMLNTVLHASLGGCGMACASVRRVLSVCLFVWRGSVNHNPLFGQIIKLTHSSSFHPAVSQINMPFKGFIHSLFTPQSCGLALYEVAAPPTTLEIVRKTGAEK